MHKLLEMILSNRYFDYFLKQTLFYDKLVTDCSCAFRQNEMTDLADV